MKPLSLKEHIKQSRQAVAANKAKGNRHAEIIAQLYSNPAHFIEEILQNSEDAYRNKKSVENDCFVRFELYDDRIEIFHQGKDFDEDDLKSVTTFANTTKTGQDHINLIGKFGIGFKSVFGITNFPEIHSSDYHYVIEDFEVLEKARIPQNFKTGLTQFIFPFKIGEESKLYNIVKEGLRQLGSHSLLFLDKINRIEILYADRKTTDIIEKKRENNDRYKLVTITNSIRNEENDCFLVFSEDEASEKIDIAFRVVKAKGKFHLISAKDMGLFVSFPTNQKNGLLFYVNGSFTTTPTRDKVPFDRNSTPENFQLLNRCILLFKSSVFKLRELGLVTKDFFNIIPLEDTVENTVYQLFKDKMIHILKQNKLMPVAAGKYELIDNCAFQTCNNLTELLEKRDLKELFNKEFWVNEDVNLWANSLSDSIKSKLGVIEISVEKFAFQLQLKPFFLESKGVTWFVKFYEFLADNPQLWDRNSLSRYYSLRNIPFILLSDKSLKPPFDENGKPLVYLSSKNLRKVPVVSQAVLKSEKILNFFKDLGLKEPDFKAHPDEEHIVDPDSFHEKIDKNIELSTDEKKLILSLRDQEIHPDTFRKYLKTQTDWIPLVEVDKVRLNVISSDSKEIYMESAENQLTNPGFGIVNQIPLLNIREDLMPPIEDQIAYDWAMEFVKRYLKELEFSERNIEIRELSPCLIGVYKDGLLLKTIGIAYRKWLEKQYYTHISFWNDIIAQKSGNATELYLVSDVGTEKSSIRIILNPLEEIKNQAIKLNVHGFFFNEI